ncbi:MAG: hypothetical protein ACK40X_02790 [Armatimonadota bacterium]
MQGVYLPTHTFTKRCPIWVSGHNFLLLTPKFWQTYCNALRLLSDANFRPRAIVKVNFQSLLSLNA